MERIAVNTIIQGSAADLINEVETLQKYLQQITEKKIFALDLETTSLVIQEVEIVGIAIATLQGQFQNLYTNL